MEVDSHFPPLTLKKEGFSEWTHTLIVTGVQKWGET